MADPDETRAQLRKAYTLIKAGSPSDAMGLLKPILKSDPDSAEAWWLMANAAPSSADAILAAQQVLVLKPGYEPALHLLADKRLQTVRDLISSGRQRDAYGALVPILAAQPTNVEAWWLAAQSAPTRSEAVAACQKVIALDPDHVLAREKLNEHRQVLTNSLAVKQRRVHSTRNRKGRLGCVVIVFGVLILMMISSVVFMNLTGITFGLPIGAAFSGQADLGTIGTKPTVSIGTLVVGATRDYHFNAPGNTFLFITVRFVTTRKNPGTAVKLYNSAHGLLAVGSGDPNQSTATLNATLTRGDSYTLRLIGTPNTAQGAYVIQIALISAGSGNDNPGVPNIPGMSSN